MRVRALVYTDIMEGGKPEIYENAKAFLRFTPGKLVQPEAAVAAVAVALPILI